MEKFKAYAEMIMESLNWKKPSPSIEQVEFLNAIDEAAKKFGYEVIKFGENEDDRLIKLTKVIK